MMGRRGPTLAELARGGLARHPGATVAEIATALQCNPHSLRVALYLAGIRTTRARHGRSRLARAVAAPEVVGVVGVVDVDAYADGMLEFREFCCIRRLDFRQEVLAAVRRRQQDLAELRGSE